MTKNSRISRDSTEPYQGYDVLGGLLAGALGEDYQAKQYIARTNRVIGGMLITQHRRAEGVCKTRFVIITTMIIIMIMIIIIITITIIINMLTPVT